MARCPICIQGLSEGKGEETKPEVREVLQGEDKGVRGMGRAGGRRRKEEQRRKRGQRGREDGGEGDKFSENL